MTATICRSTPTASDAPMHVLMLGWEFPPFITGGLGTACHGLTSALDDRGVRVTFVLPRSLSDGGKARDRPPTGDRSGLDVIGPGDVATASRLGPRTTGPRHAAGHAFRQASFVGMSGGLHAAIASSYARPEAARIGPAADPVAADRPVPAGAPASSPEASPITEADGGASSPAAHTPEHSAATPPPQPRPIVAAPDPATGGGDDYTGDLMQVIDRYADFCVHAARSRAAAPDVIHAHDWMTYPAGRAVAEATGRPLVVHVHSTEYDRSGEAVHPQIHAIERAGMHAADRVITVSRFTADLVRDRYGVPEDRIRVVHNGVALPAARPAPAIRRPRRRRPTVLYFGRITRQKGPEFFVRAAARVLEKVPDANFVVAGSGDQAPQMVEQAAALGLGSRMRFAGFLRGPQIERAFAMADLYVMPSVSEPFGIAPLEALSHGVPVIISRSSGVSEVLEHALKVDFWDVDAMADRMVAVLRHRCLAEALRTNGEREARGITWQESARKCASVYAETIPAA